MKWLLAAVLALPVTALAQQHSNTPLPGQLVSAKKVFVGNASSGFDYGRLVYEVFYSELQRWQKFQLVDRPSDAELAFQIAFSQKPDSAGNGLYPAIRLEVVDIQTGITLWSEDEAIMAPIGAKSIDRATINLLNRYRALVGDLAENSTSSNIQPGKKNRYQKEAK